jgi:hypothetical protein
LVLERKSDDRKIYDTIILIRYSIENDIENENNIDIVKVQDLKKYFEQYIMQSKIYNVHGTINRII